MTSQSILALPVAAQDRGIKVLLLYDMEGMSGETRHEYTTAKFPGFYAEGRRIRFLAKR